MSQESDTHDEALIERVLAAAGERSALADARRDRWEAVFSDALIVARRERRRRAAVRWLPIAAGLVAVTTLALRFGGGAPAPDAFATVIASRGVSESAGVALEAGAFIVVGERVRTGPSGYLALNISGIELRLAPDTVIAAQPGQVHVDRGRVYVDTAAAATHLDVDTAFGRVVHTGTQFLVAVEPDELTLAVREGAVELVTEWARQDFHATEDAAALVRVTPDGSVVERRVARHGGLWTWTELATPGFAVSGRSAHDALRWAARQRGARLTYLTPEARHRAEALLSAPADRALAAEEILALVSKVTYLTVDNGDGAVIRISERDDDSH